MSFCTAINCMDGRTQICVNDFLRTHFGVTYVDTITEAGPVKILAEEFGSHLAESILRRVDISVHKHGSNAVAIVAHHDCAGNSSDEVAQKKQLIQAVDSVKGRYSGVTVIGLWVDENWQVHVAVE